MSLTSFVRLLNRFALSQRFIGGIGHKQAMDIDARKISFWKVFWLALLGFVPPGVFLDFLWRWIVGEHSGFVGPDMVFLFSTIVGVVSGLLSLPLPLWVSFQLNGGFKGTLREIGWRAVVVGVLTATLLHAWPPLRGADARGYSLLRGTFVLVAVFALALFFFARRAERNLLLEGFKNENSDSQAQQAIAADRPKTGSG